MNLPKKTCLNMLFGIIDPQTFHLDHIILTACDHEINVADQDGMEKTHYVDHYLCDPCLSFFENCFDLIGEVYPSVETIEIHYGDDRYLWNSYLARQCFAKGGMSISEFEQAIRVEEPTKRRA